MIIADDEGGAGATLEPMRSHPIEMNLRDASTDPGVRHMEEVFYAAMCCAVF